MRWFGTRIRQPRIRRPRRLGGGTIRRLEVMAGTGTIGAARVESQCDGLARWRAGERGPGAGSACRDAPPRCDPVSANEIAPAHHGVHQPERHPRCPGMNVMESGAYGQPTPATGCPSRARSSGRPKRRPSQAQAASSSSAVACSGVGSIGSPSSMISWMVPSGACGESTSQVDSTTPAASEKTPIRNARW